MSEPEPNEAEQQVIGEIAGEAAAEHFAEVADDQWSPPLPLLATRLETDALMVIAQSISPYGVRPAAYRDSGWLGFAELKARPVVRALAAAGLLGDDALRQSFDALQRSYNILITSRNELLNSRYHYQARALTAEAKLEHYEGEFMIVWIVNHEDSEDLGIVGVYASIDAVRAHHADLVWTKDGEYWSAPTERHSFYVARPHELRHHERRTP